MPQSEIDREFELGEMPDWVTEDPAPIVAPSAASAPALGVVPIRRPRAKAPAAPSVTVAELIRQAIKVAAGRKGKGSREVAITELVLLEVLRELIA